MTIRVVVTGAAGQLGHEVVAAFSARGDAVLPLGRPIFELASPDPLAPARGWAPDVVVNAAAWTDVDACARDPALADRLNGHGAGQVALAAADSSALVVQISTNEVFDGQAHKPYREGDAPDPINPYGASKLLGEELVAAATSRHLIVRTAWLFGPGSVNFVTKILAAADRAREVDGRVRVVNDEWGNPTPTPWLAGAIVELVHAALQDARNLGVHHLVGEPPTSRAGWAKRILTGTGVEIEEISSASFERASSVPPRAVLGSTRHPDKTGHDWRPATDGLVADLLSSRSLTPHG